MRPDLHVGTLTVTDPRHVLDRRGLLARLGLEPRPGDRRVLVVRRLRVSPDAPDAARRGLADLWSSAAHPAREPVDERAPRPLPSTIVLSPGHMLELDADGAAGLARSGVLLDARIRPNYIGGPTSPGQPARGHVPGAISAPAHDNVTDYGNFAESDVLRAMYGALGADGSRPVGTYCGAGMSAAHSVLAMAAIGIEAAMYPGSWSQWAADPSRPVVRGASPG